ncbi:hypothetical protein [Magnetococcus sp. PR-3]|uniref:hypothetical protein n=1 Tax=Magnetococcus sp. PR-3 TaxID=3120355 RepID=UPI002FCE6284
MSKKDAQPEDELAALEEKAELVDEESVVELEEEDLSDDGTEVLELSDDDLADTDSKEEQRQELAAQVDDLWEELKQEISPADLLAALQGMDQDRPENMVWPWTYPLSKPVVIDTGKGKRKVSKITFVEPTGAHMLALDKAPGKQIGGTFAMMAAMSKLPVSLFRKLSAKDVVAISRKLAPFTGGG